ncbi:MAG: acetyl-CoA carboxylase, carboxyltransferase subunit beta [Hyphomicrobiaceae bacterium]
MNWINNVVRPKIRSFLTTKREVPDNLWVKCPETGQMVFYKDLEANLFVYPGSGYHDRMTAQARLKHLFDEGEYERVQIPHVAHDPLKFRDSRRYTDRLKDARTETELEDSVLVGEGMLDGRTVVAAAHDMRFVGGSLGMAAGEAVIAGMLRAVERRSPFILFAASGGARMQEGILSLMQMPRTTIAVQRLRDAKLPYIVVLTNPTTGGVTASYAMLGDIHIAEPGALICFAGPRVIQQTIREQLPDGFQRAEYLLAHGMIDMVVHRHELRGTLSRLCRLMMQPAEQALVMNADALETAPAAAPAGINGHAVLNGAGSAGGDGKHHAATNGSGEAAETEAEPVTEAERFDPARVNAKTRAATDANKSAPKDDARN